MSRRMIVGLVALSLIAVLVLSGCNRTIIDTVNHFDEAIIRLADGTIVQGKVQTWRDYEDGDQIQVKVDGKIYLVHSMNVTLIAE